MLLETHVRAQVITKSITEEGELIPINQEEVKVSFRKFNEHWTQIFSMYMSQTSKIFKVKFNNKVSNYPVKKDVGIIAIIMPIDVTQIRL